MDFRTALENLNIDVSTINDLGLRANTILLLNGVEFFIQENDSLRIDNQTLRDEINRLKGEQGNPSFLGKNKLARQAPWLGGSVIKNNFNKRLEELHFSFYVKQVVGQVSSNNVRRNRPISLT